MPSRVVIYNWIVLYIAIAIPCLKVIYTRNDAVWLEEAVDIRRSRILKGVKKCQAIVPSSSTLRHAVDFHDLMFIQG
jgi:hypothetical protein